MSTIGQRIKERREALGMTQEELAQHLGYKSKSTVNKVEKGINDISQSKIVEYAHALDTSVAYLMGWDDDQQRKQVNAAGDSHYIDEAAREYAEFLHKNPEYRVLFDASRKVSPEDIDFVKQMIDRMTGGDD